MSKREKQVLLLVIAGGKMWHYLAIKILSALFKRITSKCVDDSYCVIYSNSFRKESIRDSHKIVCKDTFCQTSLLKEENNILKHYQGEKWQRLPFVF